MEVFSWGANSHGQLGQGIMSEQCDKPTKVIQTWMGNISELSGGGGHSLLIDEEGRIYACGWNLQRQLGFEAKDCHTFTRIWDLSGIHFHKICAGWDSSAAITNKHVLYLWGSNAFGQLGLPREHFPNAVKPIQLELRVKNVCMGMRHTALVDINGCIWVSGSGKRGQLGLGNSITAADTFQKIPNIHKIDEVACGQHHTLAWSKEEKTLYCWGDNSHNQLGLNKMNFPQVFTPTKVSIVFNFEDIVQIFAGWTHSAVLLKTGEAIYWGRNNYGQLGYEHITENKDFHSLNIKGLKITQLGVGSEHSIALANDGSLWGWGWNEHCNTGTGNQDNVKEPLIVQNYCKNIFTLKTGAGHNFITSI